MTFHLARIPLFSALRTKYDRNQNNAARKGKHEEIQIFWLYTVNNRSVLHRIVKEKERNNRITEENISCICVCTNVLVCLAGTEACCARRVGGRDRIQDLKTVCVRAEQVHRKASHR